MKQRLKRLAEFCSTFFLVLFINGTPVLIPIPMPEEGHRNPPGFMFLQSWFQIHEARQPVPGRE